MKLEEILRERMRGMGSSVYQRYLRQELLRNWERLIEKSISEQVRPVGIERGILIVEVKSSSIKDQMKYLELEVIERLNSALGAELVRGLRIAPSLQEGESPPLEMESATITSAEQIQCADSVRNVTNEELRAAILESLISRAQSAK